MSDSPNISVLMSVYNAQAFLAKAIESILAQSCRDFELIVVDDGSSDRSWAIVEVYAQDDPRIYPILQQSNQGVAAALNRGLAVARGKFIARMDADDIALPRRFEHQLRYLQQNPQVGVVGCACPMIDYTGALIPGQIFFPGRGPVLLRWQLHFGVPVAHPAAMLRAELLRGAGGYTVGMGAEDYDLWLRLSHSVQFDNLLEPLLLYRKHPQALTIQDYPRQSKAAAQARQGYLRQLYGIELSVQDSLGLHTCQAQSPSHALILAELLQQVWDAFNRRHPAIPPAEYAKLNELYLARLAKIQHSQPA